MLYKDLDEAISLYRSWSEDYEHIDAKIREEHNQKANWLEELQRSRTLLKAVYDLLKKQDESFYVLNLLSELVFYDDIECDGYCLMEDIKDLICIQENY